MPSNSLEQEAMDRVRRMYASFDNHVAQEKKDSRPQTTSKESEESPREETKQDAKTPPTQPNSLLDIFLKDQDQSLILLLLVMLMKDGADMNLMLALVYLLI